LLTSTNLFLGALTFLTFVYLYSDRKTAEWTEREREKKKERDRERETERERERERERRVICPPFPLIAPAIEKMRAIGKAGEREKESEREREREREREIEIATVK
jgi:hypothetical protein